ncbi:cation-translocating P-type ATPase [Spiroplasma tabanidicola]|uniref:P-type Ca2+ transporter type 2C n=1 Tax=Spiroplasma tabanidicola TaxID=324079 RepID=A0A6I6C9H6_9MOLU|nr:HAD-IC family P-type ATPase [Spiroplasma tabanidicola]QGS51575.1 P-type Ca2+ transporter type 2C [Spiroplasma tabanidicola]
MQENQNVQDLSFSQELDKYSKKWHALSNERILKILKTNQKSGLTTQEAAKRLEEFGRNTLPKPKKPNIFAIFFKSFLDPLCIMMAIAGIASLIIGLINTLEAPDIAGLIIIAVIILTNSIIATLQEWKSLNQKEAIKNNVLEAVVLRDGKQTRINIEELVPGDIIYTKSGDFVPADSRIIDNQMLKVDESALTGENEAVEKVDEVIEEQHLVLGDQKNIAFMSTLVVEGKMVGVVFNTGRESEIGKIATKISETKKQKTPLEHKVSKLTLIIGLASVILGAIIFGIAYVNNEKIGESIYKLLLVAVSSAISIIPESLTIIVKICLFIATKKMARKNVMIKKPKSIETLGNVNVICSDKTGTLTQNKMFVDSLYMSGKEYKAKEIELQEDPLVRCMALCNDGVINKKGEKIGNATDLALVGLLMDNKINYQAMRRKYKRVDEIPFDSKRKVMSTVNQVDGPDGKYVAYTKGAMDYLIPHCKHIVDNDIVRPITDQDIENIKEQLLVFAKKGMRTLGFAKKDLDEIDLEQDYQYEDKLVFMGLVAIIDPPREEVKYSIEDAHNAGIRVIMITGDHKVTAFEIASRLGITDEQYNDVITGAEIESLSNEELIEKLKSTNVFARVNPEHKALIVDLLQSQNNIVAMTGDGVNDSPSLVKADVGIAMGITGTEVSKKVSDVILTDDNFKSIISGINSGRNVYEKIKYSISFLVAANISQVLTILIVLGIFGQLALNSVNILFHIFVVETIVAIPIGMQRERKGVMLNPPPTHKKESLLKGIITQICLTTLFNTLFAVLNYSIADIYVMHSDLASSKEELQKLASGYAKAGSYICIMNSPIFYAILFNNRFLPIKNDNGETIIDKYKPNKWLIILMCIALTLTTLTMLPFEGLNEFFDFKTHKLPAILAVIFIINTLLTPICIYLVNLIVLKTTSNMKKNLSKQQTINKEL